ncbi:MAG: plastocyanin/azurin family copper-binding protein [Anaerolineae bacterium]
MNLKLYRSPIIAVISASTLLIAIAIAIAIIWIPSLVNASQTTGVIIGTAEGADFFTPSTATISVGDTVTYTNSGRGFHNVVFDPEFSTASVPDGFTADPASTDEWSKVITFDTPGTYFFFCDPHLEEGMVSRITVEANLQEFYLPLIVR